MKAHEWRDAISAAADLAAEHEQRLRQLCLDALADGVPAVLVAEAAGVNRTTLWRWQQDT